MSQKIPPVPEGAKVLGGAVLNAFNQTAARFPLTTAEVMVGLTSATTAILAEVSAQSGHPLPKLLEDYKASLKLPPSETDGG